LYNVQALVVGATGFVTGGEANASAGYTPVLPIQPATSGANIFFNILLIIIPPPPLGLKSRFRGLQDITGCNLLTISRNSLLGKIKHCYSVFIFCIFETKTEFLVKQVIYL